MRLVGLTAFVAIVGIWVGCGKDAGQGALAGDAAHVDVDGPESEVIDATSPDPDGCDRPADCAWIESYQREIVGRLAGPLQIAPEVVLAHRATASEREHARVYLLGELTRLGFTPERHEYRSTGTNVVATLLPDAGSADAGLIVIGAHYDSVSAGPGAADNATGVAIVLAAARYFRQRPGRRHPIALVLFDEEEIGLVGSRAYVAQLLTRQVPVTAAHCFDMLSFDMDADRAIELWSPVTALEAAYRASGVAAGVPIQPVIFTRSDHQAFLDRGLPAVGIGEEFVGSDHTQHYHRATDTFDKVDFTYLAHATRFSLGVIEQGVAAN